MFLFFCFFFNICMCFIVNLTLFTVDILPIQNKRPINLFWAINTPPPLIINFFIMTTSQSIKLYNL